MLSQGILFGNEGRPYVLRRILRRAVRHGYLIGFRKPFMAKLLDTLIKIMGGHYTELVENQNFVKEQLTLEEDRFFKTIDLGMSLFNDELAKTKEIFSGEIAFKLYDTYGFPLDLTEDKMTLSMSPEGCIEVVARYLVSIISLLSPEELVLYCDFIPHILPLYEEMATLIPKKYIPPIAKVDNMQEYILLGTMILSTTQN